MLWVTNTAKLELLEILTPLPSNMLGSVDSNALRDEVLPFSLVSLAVKPLPMIYRRARRC